MDVHGDGVQEAVTGQDDMLKIEEVEQRDVEANKMNHEGGREIGDTGGADGNEVEENSEGDGQEMGETGDDTATSVVTVVYRSEWRGEAQRVSALLRMLFEADVRELVYKPQQPVEQREVSDSACVVFVMRFRAGNVVFDGDGKYAGASELIKQLDQQHQHDDMAVQMRQNQEQLQCVPVDHLIVLNGSHIDKRKVSQAFGTTLKRRKRKVRANYWWSTDPDSAHSSQDPAAHRCSIC